MAGLMAVWALFLFWSHPKLTLDRGAVVISCDSIAQSGESDVGDSGPQPTFDETAGKLPVENPGYAEETTAAWANMNGQCDRRRTTRLAYLVFILVPATVLATLGLVPSTRRRLPDPAEPDPAPER